MDLSQSAGSGDGGVGHVVLQPGPDETPRRLWSPRSRPARSPAGSFPGGVCGRMPRRVRLARPWGSRFRWVSSSASTTARQLDQPGHNAGHHMVVIEGRCGRSAWAAARSLSAAPAGTTSACRPFCGIAPDPRSVHAPAAPAARQSAGSAAARPAAAARTAAGRPARRPLAVEPADPAAHRSRMALQQHGDLGR